MEQDQFIPGYILYIEDHSVKTLNLETKESWVISGDSTRPGYREGVGKDAMFNVPSSIHQRDAAALILLDSENGCIRTISRLTNETQKLAGFCRLSGDKDGNFDFALIG